MPLTEEEQKKLIAIASNSIRNYFLNQDEPPSNPGGNLNDRLGAFVSLYIGESLRGCIGVIETSEPLYLTIWEMARKAAFCDPRFHPLKEKELSQLSIEISVLSPMKKISSEEEIEIGRDGLYIVKKFKRGLLLPQVAARYGWDKKKFLAQTCLKAGLPENAWEEGAEIFAFSAQVFS